MKEIPASEAPHAYVTFQDGSYHDALVQYSALKDWCIRHGLPFRRDFNGLIESPRFKGEKTENPIPNDISGLDGWSTRMVIQFHPESRAWLESLPLPEGATLRIEPPPGGGNLSTESKLLAISEAESFLNELDLRIRGGRNTPPASQERLRAIRPFLILAARRNPEKFAQIMRDFLAKIDDETSLTA